MDLLAQVLVVLLFNFNDSFNTSGVSSLRTVSYFHNSQIYAIQAFGLENKRDTIGSSKPSVFVHKLS